MRTIPVIKLTEYVFVVPDRFGDENVDIKKMLKTSAIALVCIAAVVLMILLSGLQNGNTGAAQEDGSGSVMILYTSDIHCGVNEGFGLAGLKAVRSSLENRGYETILVDDGDAIQGNALGMLTGGEAMIRLMNQTGYDIAVPGNHEFDYTADHFLELAKKADFPYICCNFTKNGKLVFEPYIIKEAGGMKIAFVGVDTPQSLVTSAPEHFKDKSGKLVYGFREGGHGQQLYDAVQKAVDSARAEGADYVYVLGHLGNNPGASPWTCEDVISHTNGVDVLLDGHSHDTEQMVVKNKDGEDVVRSACGTKMEAIGYSELSKEEGIKDTNIWTWSNDISAPELMGIDNSLERHIDAVTDELNTILSGVIGKSDFELTINDPEKKDSSGVPLRIVRNAETNLGDFCADATRIQLGADIGLVNSGGIRMSLEKGDISYGDILEAFPFNNDMVIVEVSGQDILDALEWGARSVPDESGAFLQVSGLTYEIDAGRASACTQDEEGLFTGVSGERRVKNVKVAGKTLDPSASYTVAGNEFMLCQNGDGFTMFDDASNVVNKGKLDSEVLIDYVQKTLGGEIGSDYSDPYGDGRIKISQ